MNLPLAMALLVIIWVHVESFRARGFKGYFNHYRQPYAALAPINVIEEITKPITLTFRLFGNLFSGGLMIAVMTTLLPIYVAVSPSAAAPSVRPSVTVSPVARPSRRSPVNPRLRTRPVSTSS